MYLIVLIGDTIAIVGCAGTVQANCVNFSNFAATSPFGTRNWLGQPRFRPRRILSSFCRPSERRTPTAPTSRTRVRRIGRAVGGPRFDTAVALIIHGLCAPTSHRFSSQLHLAKNNPHIADSADQKASSLSPCVSKSHMAFLAVASYRVRTPRLGCASG